MAYSKILVIFSELLLWCAPNDLQLPHYFCNQPNQASFLSISSRAKCGDKLTVTAISQNETVFQIVCIAAYAYFALWSGVDTLFWIRDNFGSFAWQDCRAPKCRCIASHSLHSPLLRPFPHYRGGCKGCCLTRARGFFWGGGATGGNGKFYVLHST